MSYSTFSHMKDSLMTTTDIMFLFDQLCTEFPMMHTTMVLIVSSPSSRVEPANRFCGLFMYKEGQETGDKSLQGQL